MTVNAHSFRSKAQQLCQFISVLLIFAPQLHRICILACAPQRPPAPRVPLGPSYLSLASFRRTSVAYNSFADAAAFAVSMNNEWPYHVTPICAFAPHCARTHRDLLFFLYFIGSASRVGDIFVRSMIWLIRDRIRASVCSSPRAANRVISIHRPRRAVSLVFV